MISVVILTYNEELHIERAIASVQGIATEIYVIDSYSSDETVALCEKAGARVVQHPFVNQAKQLQWALDTLPLSADWVMRLDADEIIEKDLAEEIRKKLPLQPPDVTGIYINRKHIFMNHWVRHGGRYPLKMLRIWRRGKARVEDRWMDEHVLLTEGRGITLQGGFDDWNLHDLTYFTEKHNKYATREAIDVLCHKYHLHEEPLHLGLSNCSGQASAKRWCKEKIYNHMPLWGGPLCYFLWRYIFQRGFLDGRSGMIYHFLQGFWYRFLVEAKLYELEVALDGERDSARMRMKIEKYTGYHLAD